MEKADLLITKTFWHLTTKIESVFLAGTDYSPLK